MKKIGAYIHIPFCKKKCFYCDFISFPNVENLQEEYIYALLKEIEKFFYENKNINIKTLYIGGGTPSYINEIYIEKILEKFNINKIQEITIEVNPGTANKQKLETYKKAGVNRLSIGLQTANDNLLNKIGRIHNFEDFLNTYYLAKEVGFNNINVDLMIGLPAQTIQDVKDSIEKVLKLDPNHISVYSLIVEEGTKIYKMLENKEIDLPDEELERNMYWYVKNTLELKGYRHYEISNFAKEGCESKHNLDCWNQKEYIGFGLNSHSYIDKVRLSNTSNLEEYINNCKLNNFEKNKIIQEMQGKEDKEKEYMLLGLRKIDGVSIKEFKNKFGENPIFIYRKELNKLVNSKFLVIEEDNIKLTNYGLDFANIVWKEFC